MSAEPIDFAAVKAAHEGHGADHLGMCLYQAADRRGRCLTYRLALDVERLADKVARVSIIANDHDTVSALEYGVVRDGTSGVGISVSEAVDYGVEALRDIRAALADQPKQAT